MDQKLGEVPADVPPPYNPYGQPPQGQPLQSEVPSYQQPPPLQGYSGQQGFSAQSGYVIQPGYPPQGQSGYSAQAVYPQNQQPPVYTSGPHSNVVVTQPVTMVGVAPPYDPEVQRLRNMNIGFMVFAGVVALVCGNLIFGGIAFLFALFAEFDFGVGKKDAGRCKAWTSFGFSCAGILVVIILVIILVTVAFSVDTSM